MPNQTFPQAVEYADFILQVGLNLQAGQRVLVINSLLTGVDVRLAPFVQTVVERAYARGAAHVDVIWHDPAHDLSWLRHTSSKSLGALPRWYSRALLEHLQAGDALLMLYAEDPDLYAGLDPRLVAAAQAARREPIQPARAYIHREAVNWTVASAPIPPWSALVLPDLPEEERDLALWRLILQACRFDRTADPVHTWQVHLDELAARARWLNEQRFEALLYTAPGTRLKIGLPHAHHWMGGRSVSPGGLPFVANLPTEEVATLPHRDRVEGVVAATRPVHYGGQTIDGLKLEFADGRVVAFSAQTGQEALEQILHTDAGSARLGEVALVAHSSPLAQLGVVFHNNLFDENTGCHLALGSAFQVSLRDGVGLSEAEFADQGGNSSRVHVDFVLGSQALDIDGITPDGEVKAVLRGGEWAFLAGKSSTQQR